MSTTVQAAYIGNNAFCKLIARKALDDSFYSGLTFSAQAYDASDDSTAGAAVAMTEDATNEYYYCTIPEASINGIATIYIKVDCSDPVSSITTADMTQAVYTGE